MRIRNYYKIPEGAICIVPKCGKAVVARERCPVHYRDHLSQLAVAGESVYGSNIVGGKLPEFRLPLMMVEDMKQLCETEGITPYKLLQTIIMKWVEQNSGLRAEHMVLPYRETNFVYQMRKVHQLPTGRVQTCIPGMMKLQLKAAAHLLQIAMSELVTLISVGWYEGKFGKGMALSGRRHFTELQSIVA